MNLNNFCKIYGEFIKSEQGISNSFRHCLTRIQISHHMEFFCFPCFFYVKIDSIKFNYIFYLKFNSTYTIFGKFSKSCTVAVQHYFTTKVHFYTIHLIHSILPRFAQISSMLLINSNKHILALVHHIITFTCIFI